MTGLTKDRITPYREGTLYSDPVAAGAVIYAGALVVLNASRDAAPGSTATGLIARGAAQEHVDSTGGLAGEKRITSRAGVFRFANDGTITRADIGATAYIVDDQTVADNDATGTRSAAGPIVDVDGDRVWVSVACRTASPGPVGPGGDLGALRQQAESLRLAGAVPSPARSASTSSSTRPPSH